MKKTEPLGFRIFRQEPLPNTFKRVIYEQLQQSLLLSNQFNKVPDTATHEIRKSTKRLRAVYRLFRQAVGNEQFVHGKEFYSNMSHVLADQRMSQVFCDTLRMIQDDKRMPVNRKMLNELSKELDSRHRDLTRKVLKEQRTHQLLTGSLDAEIKSLEGDPTFPCNFRDLSPGLRKTYSRGRKCLALIMDKPTTESFHDLRKAVKLLWNQLLLVRPIWPSYYSYMVHQLDILAQKLGLEHDLAELERFLREEKTGMPGSQKILLTDYILKRRQLIQKSILPLGQRLYAARSREVATRMEVCYQLYLK